MTLQTVIHGARVALVLAVAAAAVAVPLTLDRQLQKARVDREQLRADFAAYRGQAEANTRKAVEAARLAERQIHNRQQENLDAALKDLTAARADAAAARSAHDRLRQRAAALAATARCVPGPAAAAEPGAPASAPADLLADVLGRAADRARQLADYADAARIAGEQCQRDYDALMPR